MDDLGRLRLAPGLRVVRRGLHHLQIGLYDGRRVVLPRTPAVEDTLGALLENQDPGPEGAPVLAALWEQGCLAPQEPVRDRARRIHLTGDLGGARELLAQAGVLVVGAGSPVDVVLVVSRGEVDRDRLDPLVRRGTSHLVVRLVDGAALVGPFVVPGETACLRCIDAFVTIEDPDHVPVTNRYVRATSRPRHDGVPDLADPVLAAMAVAWAVHDVVAHLDGHRPSTWSRTLLFDRDPSRRREQNWSRHPECGCCWSAHTPLSGTMGV